MFEARPNQTEKWNRGSGAGVSALLHGIAIVTVLALMHPHARIELFKLPGTRSGVQFLTYYSPGSTRAAANTIQTKIIDKPVAALAVRPTITAPKTDSSSAVDSKLGDADAGQSGIGDGNITIALQKYFPYPKPSLTSLPQGSAGDVILKAVIDEHGKITELTLLAGLGPAIDYEVIQTVNQWVYIPAMKDGVPVPSVEELHFHYEKRG
jgi:hypothetical protein